MINFKLGFARTGSRDPKGITIEQHNRLEAAGCARVIHDNRGDILRPGFTQAMFNKPRPVAIVITSVDRLANDPSTFLDWVRTTQHHSAIIVLDGLDGDPSKPFHSDDVEQVARLMEMADQHDAQVLERRQRCAAMIGDRRTGRPATAFAQREEIVRLRQQFPTMTQSEIASRLGLSAASISRVLKSYVDV